MIEYEARILEINKEKLEEKLKSLNAKKVADFDYKRLVYDFNPADKGRWIRLRTDGRKTTLTVKEVKSYEIDGTEENEIEVSDFETTNIILNKLGYIAKSYQENKRTRYLLDGVEIDIDDWPLIPTYLEIEGPSEVAVHNTLETLGFKREEATTNDVDNIYKDYGININIIDNLELEEERKK